MTATSGSCSQGAQPGLDEPSDRDTVRIALEYADTGGIVIFLVTGHDEEWTPVTDEELRRGMELLLARESRLERAAAGFGMEAETLLASLEDSMVHVRGEAAGIPEAEREAFAEAGIDLAGSAEDPTGAGEVLTGLARFVEFRDEALSVAQVAALLGKTEGRVRQMISAGHLVTIPQDEAGHLLPRWQFAGNRQVPGLAEVLASVGAVHPLTLAGFMTRPDADLVVEGRPVSPVEWLLSGGEIAPIAELAAGLTLRV